MKNNKSTKKFLFTSACITLLSGVTPSFAMDFPDGSEPKFDSVKKMFYYGPSLSELSRQQRALVAEVESQEKGIIFPIINSTDEDEPLISDTNIENKQQSNFQKTPRKKYYKNTESILKNRDRRKLVKDAKEYPWCVRGQLLMTYFNENPAEDPAEYIGSGTLIGEKYVLTAAHNLYDDQLGVPDRISFVTGLEGTDNFLTFSNASYATMTYEYVNSPEKEVKEGGDIGLIFLDKPIKTNYPLPSIKILNNDALKKKEVTVAGYPGIDYMFHMTGPIEVVDPNQLFYDIDTEPGQSGSGMCYEEAKQHYIIGVHSYGTEREKEGNLDKESKKYKYNSGTRITQEKNALIDGWIKYLNQK